MAKSKTRKVINRVIKSELDILLRKLHELLEGFDTDGIVDFSSPELRADIESFESGVLPQLPEQTRLFQLALPDFCPRVLIFEKKPDDATEGWDLIRSITGHPGLYLEGSRGVISATAKALASEDFKATAMAVWVCPVPTELPGLIAVVTHRDGDSQIYLRGPEKFSRIPSTPIIFDSLTSSIDQYYGNFLSFARDLRINPDSSIAIAVAEEERRRLGKVDSLSSVEGGNLLSTIELIAQAAAERPLAESLTMSRLMRDVTTHYEKKLREAKNAAIKESELLRETTMRRLRGEADKQKMMASGAIARANRLEDELKHLRQSSGPSPRAQVSSPTFGLGPGLSALFATL